MPHVRVVRYPVMRAASDQPREFLNVRPIVGRLVWLFVWCGGTLLAVWQPRARYRPGKALEESMPVPVGIISGGERIDRPAPPCFIAGLAPATYDAAVGSTEVVGGRPSPTMTRVGQAFRDL